MIFVLHARGWIGIPQRHIGRTRVTDRIGTGVGRCYRHTQLIHKLNQTGVIAVHFVVGARSLLIRAVIRLNYCAVECHGHQIFSRTHRIALQITRLIRRDDWEISGFHHRFRTGQLCTE